MTRWSLCIAVALVAAGCPPAATSEDAATAPDIGSLDAPRPDARRCALECETTLERCCTSAEGIEACIDVSADPENCGLCGLDCAATRRGDRCIAMQCSCGAFSIGCTGERDSSCCPPAADGRTERCANLGRDFGDCGECGRTCDVRMANRCEAGSCVCGLAGDVCAGTREDFCCIDPVEVASCVDTTSDDLHCGECNVRCGAFENCIDGVCVDFTIPDAGPIDAASFDAGRDAATPALDAAFEIDGGAELDANTTDALSADDTSVGPG